MGRSSIDRFLTSAASRVVELDSVLARHKAALIRDAAGITLRDVLAAIKGTEPEIVRPDQFFSYRMNEHMFVGLYFDLLAVDYFFSVGDIEHLLRKQCSAIGEHGDGGYRFRLKEYSGKEVAAFHRAEWKRYGA